MSITQLYIPIIDANGNDLKFGDLTDTIPEDNAKYITLNIKSNELISAIYNQDPINNNNIIANNNFLNTIMNFDINKNRNTAIKMPINTAPNTNKYTFSDVNIIQNFYPLISVSQDDSNNVKKIEQTIEFLNNIQTELSYLNTVEHYNIFKEKITNFSYFVAINQNDDNTKTSNTKTSNNTITLNVRTENNPNRITELKYYYKQNENNTDGDTDEEDEEEEEENEENVSKELYIGEHFDTIIALQIFQNMIIHIETELSKHKKDDAKDKKESESSLVKRIELKYNYCENLHKIGLSDNNGEKLNEVLKELNNLQNSIRDVILTDENKATVDRISKNVTKLIENITNHLKKQAIIIIEEHNKAQVQGLATKITLQKNGVLTNLEYESVNASIDYIYRFLFEIKDFHTFREGGEENDNFKYKYKTYLSHLPFFFINVFSKINTTQFNNFKPIFTTMLKKNNTDGYFSMHDFTYISHTTTDTEEAEAEKKKVIDEHSDPIQEILKKSKIHRIQDVSIRLNKNITPSEKQCTKDEYIKQLEDMMNLVRKIRYNEVVMSISMLGSKDIGNYIHNFKDWKIHIGDNEISMLETNIFTKYKNFLRFIFYELKQYDSDSNNLTSNEKSTIDNITIENAISDNFNAANNSRALNETGRYVNIFRYLEILYSIASKQIIDSYQDSYIYIRMLNHALYNHFFIYINYLLEFIGMIYAHQHNDSSKDALKVLKEFVRKKNSDNILTYIKFRNDNDDYYNPRYNFLLDQHKNGEDTESRSMVVQYANNDVPYYNSNNEKIKNYDVSYNEQYTFGNFTKIFEPKLTNEEVAESMSEIIYKLNKNKTVFIMGYGASGAGKTSTLIQLNITKSGGPIKQPGILIELCKAFIKNKKGKQVTGIELRIQELYNDFFKQAPNNDKGSKPQIHDYPKDSPQDPQQDPQQEWLQFKYDDNSIKLQQEYTHTMSHSYAAMELDESTKTKLGIKEEENNNKIIYKRNFEKNSEMADVIDFLVNYDRLIKATTNNDESSRSHVIVYVRFKIDKKKETPCLIVGDFAGVENEFKCDQEMVKNQFLNIKMPKKKIESEPFFYGSLANKDLPSFDGNEEIHDFGRNSKYANDTDLQDKLSELVTNKLMVLDSNKFERFRSHINKTELIRIFRERMEHHKNPFTSVTPVSFETIIGYSGLDVDKDGSIFNISDLHEYFDNTYNIINKTYNSKGKKGVYGKKASNDTLQTLLNKLTSECILNNNNITLTITMKNHRSNLTPEKYTYVINLNSNNQIYANTPSITEMQKVTPSTHDIQQNLTKSITNISDVEAANTKASGSLANNDENIILMKKLEQDSNIIENTIPEPDHNSPANEDKNTTTKELQKDNTEKPQYTRLHKETISNWEDNTTAMKEQEDDPNQEILDEKKKKTKTKETADDENKGNNTSLKVLLTVINGKHGSNYYNDDSNELPDGDKIKFTNSGVSNDDENGDESVDEDGDESVDEDGLYSVGIKGLFLDSIDNEIQKLEEIIKKEKDSELKKKDGNNNAIKVLMNEKSKLNDGYNKKCKKTVQTIINKFEQYKTIPEKLKNYNPESTTILKKAEDDKKKILEVHSNVVKYNKRVNDINKYTKIDNDLYNNLKTENFEEIVYINENNEIIDKSNIIDIKILNKLSTYVELNISSLYDPITISLYNNIKNKLETDIKKEETTISSKFVNEDKNKKIEIILDRALNTEEGTTYTNNKIKKTDQGMAAFTGALARNMNNQDKDELKNMLGNQNFTRRLSNEIKEYIKLKNMNDSTSAIDIKNELRKNIPSKTSQMLKDKLENKLEYIIQEYFKPFNISYLNLFKESILNPKKITVELNNLKIYYSGYTDGNIIIKHNNEEIIKITIHGKTDRFLNESKKNIDQINKNILKRNINIFTHNNNFETNSALTFELQSPIKNITGANIPPPNNNIVKNEIEYLSINLEKYMSNTNKFKEGTITVLITSMNENFIVNNTNENDFKITVEKILGIEKKKNDSDNDSSIINHIKTLNGHYDKINSEITTMESYIESDMYFTDVMKSNSNIISDNDDSMNVENIKKGFENNIINSEKIIVNNFNNILNYYNGVLNIKQDLFNYSNISEKEPIFFKEMEFNKYVESIKNIEDSIQNLNSSNNKKSGNYYNTLINDFKNDPSKWDENETLFSNVRKLKILKNAQDNNYKEFLQKINDFTIEKTIDDIKDENKKVFYIYLCDNNKKKNSYKSNIHFNLSLNKCENDSNIISFEIDTTCHDNNHDNYINIIRDLSKPIQSGGSDVKPNNETLIDILALNFIIQFLQKEAKFRKTYIRTICNNRKYEGQFINASLQDMRENIRTMMKIKNENTIDIVPDLIQSCIDYYCPTKTACFDFKEETNIKSDFQSILMKTMYDTLKNDTSVKHSSSSNTIDQINQGIKEVKNFYKNFQLCVFCVFNMTGNYKTNNPPPIPYVNINDLKHYWYSYKNNILSSGDKKTPDTLYIEPTMDINEQLRRFVSLVFSGDYKSQFEKLYQKAIKTIDIHNDEKTSTKLSVLNHDISLYKNNYVNGRKHNIKITAMENIIKCIDNSNALSAIGTLEFMDQIAKFNTTNVVYNISYVESEGSKITDKTEFHNIKYDVIDNDN